MADLSLLGVYWQSRGLTLRGYCDFLKAVLRILRSAHSAFLSIHWNGDGKRTRVAVDSDMRNLDELVYQYSWGGEDDLRYISGERNADGSPTWTASHRLGFDMIFDVGQSSKKGGLTITVRAGNPENITPNTINITFPPANHTVFAHREFYEYEFILSLFTKLLRLAQPDRGLVTSRQFSTSIFGDGPYDIGWLTYFSDDRCKSLAKRFSTEKIDLRGTLFSLGKERMFVQSDETVSLGRSLRESLKKAEVLS